MSTCLSVKTPVARKQHLCGWCGEPIVKGERYSRWNGIADGGFQSNALHGDCAEACAQMLSEGWDDEYSPYMHMRGTTCEIGCECELHTKR